MNREEAIIEYIVPAINRTWNEEVCKKILEALEQEPCTDAISRQNATAQCSQAMELISGEFKCELPPEKKSYNAGLRKAIEIIRALPPVNPQEPCGDAISRQAVIRTIYDDKSDFKNDFAKGFFVDKIRDLPPVSPQPKTGHWIACSDRLPKAGEYIGDVAKYYLVQNEYGDMLVARYTHSGYWEQIYQLNPISDEIVAWMPLPTPFNMKGGGE